MLTAAEREKCPDRSTIEVRPLISLTTVMLELAVRSFAQRIDSLPMASVGQRQSSTPAGSDRVPRMTKYTVVNDSHCHVLA